MPLISEVRTCLRKYLTFSGRASRREYWLFVLFLFLGSLLLGLVDAALFDPEIVETGDGHVDYRSTGPLAGLFSLITLPPLVSAGWRRMHDTGRSGLFLVYPVLVMVGIVTFMGFMGGLDPMLAGDFAVAVAGGASAALLIAFFVLLISPLLVVWWLTRPSEAGPNAYGPNPNGVWK